MSEQWFDIGRCVYCGATLYDLHYPTTVGWNPTGRHRWKGGDPDCRHRALEMEVDEDEVRTCPDN